MEQTTLEIAIETVKTEIVSIERLIWAVLVVLMILLIIWVGGGE